MRRAAALALTAGALCAGAAVTTTDASAARTFAVIENPAAAVLPPATAPNLPGSIRMPFAISTPPSRRQELSFSQLAEIWRHAGAAYDVPWQVLAAINKIESNFGSNMGPSSAGAVGWMQFLPSTWERWGVDGDGDGLADPWNATDAIYSAARYLAATGAPGDLHRAVFAYNHSEEYVADVLSLARVFDPAALPEGLVGGGENRVFSVDPLQHRIDRVERTLDRRRARVQRMLDRLDRLRWSSERIDRRAGDPLLSDAAFQRVERTAARVERDQDVAAGALERAQADLLEAERQLAALHREAQAIPAVQGGTQLNDDFARFLPTPPSPAAARVIDWALQQLGTPYLWGGHHGYSLEQMVTQEPSLWDGGFDCSSLLAWAFAKGSGIYIGDYTGSQWAAGASAPGAIRGPGPAQGGALPPGGLRPGDIIFFNDTDHVALYLGNDLFVHAPHTGDVVKITQLSTYNPVWGWVRYEQISGAGDGSDQVADAPPGPPETGPVFSVVSEG
ncbi:MAG: lytic murein transglycosylase [Thermoleophilia bacterium]